MRMNTSEHEAPRRWLRLAHGWRIDAAGTARDVIDSFIRPVVRAVPTLLAGRLVRCDISLPVQLEGDAASRWSIADDWIGIEVAREGVDPHDLAIDVLVCVGQVLWEFVTPNERRTWLLALRTEIANHVRGEIDEPAVLQKRNLLSSPATARSRRHMNEYARDLVRRDCRRVRACVVA